MPKILLPAFCYDSPRNSTGAKALRENCCSNVYTKWLDTTAPFFIQNQYTCSKSSMLIACNTCQQLSVPPGKWNFSTTLLCSCRRMDTAYGHLNIATTDSGSKDGMKQASLGSTVQADSRSTSFHAFPWSNRTRVCTTESGQGRRSTSYPRHMRRLDVEEGRHHLTKVDISRSPSVEPSTCR